MDELAPGETFEEFRRSFSYGTRTDLNFKFFKSASDDEAADFLQTILDELGEAFDTGRLDILVQTVIDAQAEAYAPDPDAPPAMHVYDTGPFTPTAMPVAGSRIGLLTSTGHFVDGDDPEPFGEPEMTQQQAIDRISDFLKDTPTLSVVPSTIDDADLRVRHGGYDITSISRDRNVAFPVDRLAEAAQDGRIGGVPDNSFSFPGATAQGRLKNELPGWIERIDEEEPDVLLLVPV
ncbi:MAG: glycine/sarcosine/betaine reductase selenoprotein B family protein [Acidimicrobiia bacterium]